jgi:O-antigen ligase
MVCLLFKRKVIMTLLSNRLIILSPGLIGIGQILVIAQIVALFFSPPLVNLSEFLLYLIAVFVPQVRSQIREFLFTTAGKWFLAFLAIIIIGALWGWFQKTLDFGVLVSWRKILILPVAAALFKVDARAQRFVLVVFLAVCTAAALVSLYRLSIVGDGSVVRNYSTQSMFFSVGIVSALYLCVHTSDKLTKLICASSFLLILCALVFGTAGRSGYLAVVVMLAGFFVLSMVRRWSLIQVGLVALALLTLALGLMFSPLASKRTSQAVAELREPVSSMSLTSLGQRKLFWHRTIEMLPRYAAFGAGTGSFKAAYQRHIYDNYPGVETILTRDPHNQFLKITIEHGAVGLVVLSGLLFSLGKNFRGSPYGALGLLVMAGWVASSFFNSHFTTFSEGRFIWIWLGVFLSSARLFTNSLSQER